MKQQTAMLRHLCNYKFTNSTEVKTLNIYDMLNKIVLDDKSRLGASLFSDESCQELDSTADKEIFALMKNISSIRMETTDNDVRFYPAIICDGMRSYSVEDIKESDYAVLTSLDFKNLPLKLKARVSDILWTQKKHYEYAQIAAEAYLNLFNLIFSDDNWVEARDMINRTICISAQTKQNDLYNRCCKTLYDIIVNLNGTDTGFLSISFIEIILNQKYDNIKTIIDINKIIDITDKIILHNKNNPSQVEDAYSLKAACFNKQKNNVSATQTNIDMAEYFVDYAESLLKNGKNDLFRAEKFFTKAILLYRNNGKSHKAEKTHRRLLDIQKDKLQAMHTHTITFDASKAIENISQNMDGLSFEECIIRLTQIVSFCKKDDFKNKVLKDLKSHILINLCSRSFINSSGQTIFELPPLDISDPEKDDTILDMHIHNEMREYQNTAGNFYLGFVLSYIREHFDVNNQSLEFIVHDNFIVPHDRENIFISAIRMALNGNYYEALHILAPQTENIFRNIANGVGGITSTLESDGTSKEKVLSSIFDLPELLECYDNDILFFFKGMLNEQAGANIRNRIAHGLIDPQGANSGASIYFICAVIKLLVISSRKCHEIFAGNPTLKSYIYPEAGIVDL